MQQKRILLPLAGSSVDPEVIAHAVTLAKADRAQLIAVHVIEVRWNLALDAVLEEEMGRGESLLESATRLVEQAGAKVETELLQAREAAAAILDTARERSCDLILLGMPYRQRLGKVYIGKTVLTVLSGARCAVLAYRQEQPQ